MSVLRILSRAVLTLGISYVITCVSTLLLILNANPEARSLLLSGRPDGPELRAYLEQIGKPFEPFITKIFLTALASLFSIQVLYAYLKRRWIEQALERLESRAALVVEVEVPNETNRTHNGDEELEEGEVREVEDGNADGEEDEDEADTLTLKLSGALAGRRIDAVEIEDDEVEGTTTWRVEFANDY